MADALSSCDWSLIRAFLAVAEHGSLSAAARDLGASQPTLGRQIRQLESTLGQVLFHRQVRGLNLTETGQVLLEPARRMRAAMIEIELAAAGRETTLEGAVRITASETVSQFHLPPILAQLRELHPGISIDVVSTDSSENLLFREADIAIRMYRPEQLELVAVHLGDVALGLFGSRAYFDRVGRPASLMEVFRHPLIGFDRNEDLIEGMRERGMKATRDWFAFRCDSHPVNWSLIRAGCGLGFGHREIGRDDPEVEELALPLDIPTMPVWLATHQALRHAPRIAAVWDALAEGLRARLIQSVST